MPFQITLSEQRTDGIVVPLLFGEASVDMPTLLFAYNLELMVAGSCVDCTRFSSAGDAEAELLKVISGLTWGSFEELSPGAEMRFRIEQPGDFLLESSPRQDPRPLLADVLAGSPTSGTSGLELLGVLIWDAPITAACRYAASCGWGMHSIVLSHVG